ncbi:MAG TPA: PAS domain-containing sensor histidine kinase [Rhizomicrobium sp.]|jgi:PAS domain S-box-containing protein|nr:PAS domain-containing sensor histidine kinase [Rhizomicrobium sp.]
MSEEDEKAARAARIRRFRMHIDLAERAAHFGYWRFGLTDDSYYWSPGMYRLLEQNPEQRRPDTDWLYAQMTDESRAAVETALAEAIRTRSPFSYRTYAQSADLVAQIIETQGEVEVDESGRVVALLGVCHDVTQQLRAEEAREKAQAMYRLMTEESGDIIILYAPDSKMLFCSNALERLIGRSADEIRDGGYKRFIHPDDMDEASKMISRPVDGDVVVAKWRIQHAKGHYLWLETTIRTVHDSEKGAPLHVISVSRDVTARVEAEQAREKAYEMYRVMTTEASDVILLFGPDRKILFASDAIGRVMGRGPADIENGEWLDFVHPDDRDLIRGIPLPHRSRDTLTVSYRLLHGEGHYVWLEVVTRARYAPDGTYQGYISVARDVTARKEQEIAAKAAQERAEAANRAKSEFLANMSHELRTPLNAIIGFGDLMRQGTFGPLNNPRYQDYATLIYDSGQLLLDLISDMLDMAKIEAGKLELNFERVDLTGTIEDAARLLQERAETGGVTLCVAADGTLPSLLADRRAVKQVVLNLLSNAVKFTPPGGTVRVSARQAGDMACITVADTGIGIPASEISRLGKPFEQVCGDPMLAKSGTGLGLALVKALAERHGGELTIESAEGVGTEVSVTFALAPAKRAVA